MNNEEEYLCQVTCKNDECWQFVTKAYIEANPGLKHHIIKVVNTPDESLEKMREIICFKCSTKTNYKADLNKVLTFVCRECERNLMLDKLNDLVSQLVDAMEKIIK